MTEISSGMGQEKRQKGPQEEALALKTYWESNGE
jgi:hypothetical protein